jgi:hypothetical protein
MFAGQGIFIFWMSAAENGGSEEVWLPLLGMPLFYGAMGLGMALMLVLMLLMTVGMAHMVAKDEFGAAFRFREIWSIFKKNVAGYLIAFVILMGLYSVLMMVSQVLMLTVVLCCLYPVLLLVFSTYMMIVGSVLFAQAYVEGADKVAAESTADKVLVDEVTEEASDEEPEQEDPPAS